MHVVLNQPVAAKNGGLSELIQSLLVVVLTAGQQCQRDQPIDDALPYFVVVGQVRMSLTREPTKPWQNRIIGRQQRGKFENGKSFNRQVDECGRKNRTE